MKWLTFVFSLLLLAIIYMADNGIGMTFFKLAYHIPGADKTGHLILMGTLSLLVNMSLVARKIELSGREFLLGSVIVTLVVTTEEVSQLFIMGRSFSWSDLLFDYIGIFVFGRMSTFLIARRVRLGA